MNKAYLIGAIAVLVLVSGAYFWSRNKDSVPDPSVLEKGVKNLTRDAAAAKIKEYAQLNPQMSNTYLFDEKLGHHHLQYVSESSEDVKVLRRLEQAGYIKKVTEKKTYGTLDITFDFTGQAQQYVKRQNYGTYDALVTATIASVEVTGITEPMQGLGGSMRIANFTAAYELTPIGKIIYPDWKNEPVKAQYPFTLYDDGWRIQ